MKLYEGIDIGDNVEEVKVCPNCNTKDERFPNIISTPIRDGKRSTFFTWSCHHCKKELISYQENY